MPYALLADAVLLLHLAFVAFVVAGAALLPRWPSLAVLHLPAFAWAVYVEFSGAVCPLTPLENSLLTRAGKAGYSGGFIDHYLLPLLYPETLTRDTQVWLGAALLSINAFLYGRWWWLARRRRGTLPGR
jgi:hypothetical protein